LIKRNKKISFLDKSLVLEDKEIKTEIFYTIKKAEDHFQDLQMKKPEAKIFYDYKYLKMKERIKSDCFCQNCSLNLNVDITLD
jgi:hypothetical protein